MRKYRKSKKIHRYKKKKSIFRNKFFWTLLLLLVISTSIFYFVCFSQFIQIKKIEIYGTNKVEATKVESMVEKRLNKKILFWSSKSIFLANATGIKKELAKNFPEIETIKIQKRLPSNLAIEVKERVAVAIWCHEGSDECFLIDREGIVFERGSLKNSFVIRSGNENETPDVGQRVVEGDLMNTILKIKESGLKNRGIEIKEFLIRDKERVDIITTEGWEIYFNPERDVNWQITELSLLLEKEIPPERTKNLEYIDLRFSKIYYKYK